MRRSDQRTLAWLGSILLFFPLWFVAMYGVELLVKLPVRYGRTGLPEWLSGLLFFLTVPLVLLPVSRLTAAFMDRYFPFDRTDSAAWDRQGNRSANRGGR